MTVNFAILTSLAVPVALAAAGLLVGLVLQRTVLARLARAVTQTRSQADDVVVAAVHGPAPLWGATLGLYLGVQVADLPRPLGSLAEGILVALLIVSVTWAVARLAGDLIRLRAESAPGVLPSGNLMPNLARASVLTVGGLVILDTLGIAITPLLTALGVGGLAVGLALQDTLANLFAGIHILLSRQVRPGDFVRLASGEEGYVQDVAWRYTTIRQLPNNLTIVPNAKLASAVTGFQSGGIRPFRSASATPFVHPNPSCVGYSPPPARRCTSTTSYFSVILPVAR
jgi:small-conductance mechanosensitive channel